MAWQQTPFTIPLVAAAASSLFIGAVAWRHRDYTGARALTALMIGGAWWSAFYALGLANSDLSVKLLAYKTMYIGVGIVPVAWVVFAGEYTGRLQSLDGRQIAGLGALPAVTVGLIWTNELHGLVWANVETVTEAGIVVMSVTFGPWFWVHAGYLYLLLGVGTLLVLRMAFLSEHVYRSQAVALIIAVLVPWGANALYLSGVTGIWDPTSVGIVFSGAILMIAIFRHQLLDVVPAAREVARDEIIDSMTEAVIVVDRRDQVVDLNPAAESLVDRSARDAIGEPVDTLLPEISEQFSEPSEASLERAEFTRAVDGLERTYDLRVTPLRRGYGTITGRLVTVRDVTERIEREQRIDRQRQLLEVINRVLRHDIRNDMNMVLAFADELRSVQPDEPLLDRIVQKGEDIVDLSKRARRFERLVGSDDDYRRVVDIARVIDRVVTDLGQSYPEAEISVDGPERARAYANDLIDSAISNLVENAIKHHDQSEPHVTVRYAVERTDGAEGVVRIDIEDDGPGLPEREREVIETGTETALEHSSGLGLWLAYWIVSRSDGEISFRENDPRGTVISIRLQATQAAEAVS